MQIVITKISYAPSSDKDLRMKKILAMLLNFRDGDEFMDKAIGKGRKLKLRKEYLRKSLI